MIPLDPRVFYCLPHSGTWVPEGMHSAMTPSYDFDVVPRIQRSTFLNHSFNTYWCQALNMEPRPTHWAMHHADMQAEPGWLDTLLQIMEWRDADVVSSVACIKDEQGLTNSGKMVDGNLHRLTVKECEALPDVFSSEDIGADLLINTGLWVVDFTKPWVEKFPGFSFSNAIVLQDGKYTPLAMSEDWKFSLWAAEQKLRVFATTRIKTTHHGNRGWSIGGTRE